jgi:hypothetical protein
MNLRVQPGLAHSRQTLDAFSISSSTATTVTGYGLPTSTNSASSVCLELRSQLPTGHQLKGSLGWFNLWKQVQKTD